MLATKFGREFGAVGASATIRGEGFQLGRQSMLIDNFPRKDLTSRLGTQWRAVSDQVMGGVSQASIAIDHIDGRNGLRLRGDVRLDNNGGFIQAALDLANAGGTFDASSYAGLRFYVRGNGEQYAVHLRSTDCVHPWQSYRVQFSAAPAWERLHLPFDAFSPYRVKAPLVTTNLRRIGLVAIGRPFEADVMISQLGFY
jgi:adhesin HecA-like repeat protein